MTGARGARRLLLLLGLPAAAACAAPSADRPAPPVPVRPETPLADAYRETAARILEEARERSLAHGRLQHLCDRIGSRLSGSEGLRRAVEWAVETMVADGLDTVAAEEVLVPVWIRGREGAVMEEPRVAELSILGLGNSVGTPEPGVRAEVVTARDFDELESLGERVRGRIVLFNRAMPPYDPARGTGYGETVAYRVQGPSRAARLGAVACLVRSVTARSLATPHTGMLRYDPDAPRIPAAAVTLEDAELLDRLVRGGTPVVVRLWMEARFEEDAPSANVVGEIRGRERPEEVVLLGAHLDSWDVGQGAHDDGGPCVAVLEAMRILRALDLRPRRTVRAVLFTNEENGLRGARSYAERHAAELPGHVAAIEADSGAYRPLGYTTPAPRDADPPEERERIGRIRARLRDVLTLLDPVGAGSLEDGGGGADISPLAPAGVPQIGLRVEMDRYFDIHHTRADTFDKIDRAELDLCAGSLAVLAFVLADMPPRLRD